MISPEYLAGFIDGEGCIRINGGSTPYVSVTNKSLPVLLAIQAVYGGNVRHCGSGAFRHETTGDRALHILRSIQPYLREKLPQAELVLRFRETVPGSHARTSLIRTLSDLKRVDYGAWYLRDAESKEVAQ